MMERLTPILEHTNTEDSMNRTHLLSSLTALFSLTLLLASCGEPADQDPTGCTPGVTQSCLCPGGGQGAQVCNADGSAWEACSCNAPGPDTGSDDPQPDAGPEPDGSPDDAGEPDPKPGEYSGDIERDMERLEAMAECEYYFECKARPSTYWTSVPYSTKRACTEYLTDAYRGSSTLSRSIADGRVTFDETSASACLSQLKTEIQQNPCDGFIFSDLEIPTVCTSQTLQGEIATGEACLNDLECRGDSSWCADVSSGSGEYSCFGRCKQRGSAGPGQMCDLAAGECDAAQDLVCNDTCIKQASLDVGDDCWANNHCRAGLICSDEGTCQTFQVVSKGEACDRVERFCPPGTICHPDTCRDMVAEGETCIGDSTASNCQAGLFCNDSSSTCVRLKTRGESCQQDLYDCAWGLTCSGATADTPGTCEPPGACQLPAE